MAYVLVAVRSVKDAEPPVEEFYKAWTGNQTGEAIEDMQELTEEQMNAHVYTLYRVDSDTQQREELGSSRD